MTDVDGDEDMSLEVRVKDVEESKTPKVKPYVSDCLKQLHDDFYNNPESPGYIEGGD